jgi:hypothetical protein
MLGCVSKLQLSARGVNVRKSTIGKSFGLESSSEAGACCDSVRFTQQQFKIRSGIAGPAESGSKGR